MFQSNDDLNLDEDFLNDIFDEIPQSSNDQNKRFSDENNEQPMKKLCTNSQNQDIRTKNILSIIKSNQEFKISEPSTFSAQDLNFKNNASPSSCFKTPDKSRKVVQRKFPGPAGILPEQKQINISALEEIDKSDNMKLEPDVILCSQYTENNFKKGTWQQMLSDWSSNKYRINLPNKYTITWTKSKAIAKKLIGQKTPFLAAVIQSIDPTNKDPMILLKDKTDEIQATLLHEVWDDYYEFLIPGSVIVLKQIGVLSTLKKQYLAITSNNLITIYSEHESEESETIENKITKVQPYTVSDIIEIIEEVKRNNESQKKRLINQPVRNNPYFKTNYTGKYEEKSSNLNTSLHNKTLQLIRSENDNKKCTDNKIQHASLILIKNEQNTSIQQNVNSPVSSKPEKTSKFNFKSRIDHSRTSSVPNKENYQSNSRNQFNYNITNNTATTSNVVNKTEENDILTQVLDGVDTASIFEDF